MLKKLFDEKELLRIININRLQNLYLFIDAFSIGLKSKCSETIVCDRRGQIVALIYVYYDSLQIMQFDNLLDNEVREMAFFCSKYKRITGPTSFISLINDILKYKQTDGWLMKYNHTDYSLAISPLVELAKIKDFKEISHLICDDDIFKYTYDYDILLKQITNRFLYERCENMIIRKNGIIVSHFASFAVLKDITILSGMITKKDYRGMGYGSILVSSLSNYYINKKIAPFIFCYEDYYYSWYKKLGYIDVIKSSKLEKQ